MSAPSRDARAGLAMVLVAAVFTYVVIRLFDIRFATGDVYPEYSSLRANPTGAKLLYDSLARLPGVSVSRNYAPLEYLEGSGASILLLGLDADTFRADPETYLDPMEKLAARGNRLVVALKYELNAAPQSSTLEKRWRVKYGFDADKNHAHRLYFAEATDWKVLDRDGPKILAIERDFSKGSVVLISESADFANQATVKFVGLGLVSTAIGANSRVIFDEQHFGIAESGTVVGLAVRFRLIGMAIGLGICAAFFIWKNAASFPPPLPAPRPEALSGRTSMSGLFTLLRRHVKPADLAATCWNEWLAGNRDASPEKVERARAILRDRGSKPLDAVREIQTVFETKGPL